MNSNSPVYVEVPFREASAAAATSTVTGPEVVDFGTVNALRCQLKVTAASGTTPTLDVKLQDSVDGTNWNDLGITFTQATGATTEMKDFGSHQGASYKPFAKRLRYVATIAGTTPSFTFSLIVAGRNI